jgi:hypothetical protein
MSPFPTVPCGTVMSARDTGADGAADAGSAVYFGYWGSEPRTTLVGECSALPLNGCSETSIRE